MDLSDSYSDFTSSPLKGSLKRHWSAEMIESSKMFSMFSSVPSGWPTAVGIQRNWWEFFFGLQRLGFLDWKRRDLWKGCINLHHLGCINPCKGWDKRPFPQLVSLPDFWTTNRMDSWMCGLECSGQADSSDTPSMGKNVCSLGAWGVRLFFFWGGVLFFFGGTCQKEHANGFPFAMRLPCFFCIIMNPDLENPWIGKDIGPFHPRRGTENTSLVQFSSAAHRHGLLSLPQPFYPQWRAVIQLRTCFKSILLNWSICIYLQDYNL